MDKCDSRFEFMPGKLVQCTKDADHVTSEDPATKSHGCSLAKGASLNWDDDAAYQGDGGDIIPDIMSFLRDQSAARVN